MKTACQTLVGYGFGVIVGTVTPRSITGTRATFEADRQTVNSRIRANAVAEGWAVAVADVGSDALMGQAGQETNTNYFADLIHPTTAGYYRLADNYFIPTLNAVLAGS